MKKYNTFEDMISDMVLLPACCKECGEPAGGVYMFKEDIANMPPNGVRDNPLTYCSSCLQDAINEDGQDMDDMLTDAEADADTLAYGGRDYDEDYGG